MSGFLILMLIYGKKNKQKVNEIVEDFIFIPLALSFAFIMWFICLMLAGIDSGDQIGCIIYGIAFPAALVAWSIIVRRKPNQENTTEEAVPENSTNTLDPAHIYAIQDQLDSLIEKPSKETSTQGASVNDPSTETPEAAHTEHAWEETLPSSTTPHEDDKEALSRQLSEEQQRYLSLKEELAKIPVERVKQWYHNGTLTETQFRTIVRKYNTIVREMKDIKDRLALLESLHNGAFDE